MSTDKSREIHCLKMEINLCAKLLHNTAEQRAKLERENARLRNCLERYGWHDKSCPRYPTWSNEQIASGQVKLCDCGFDKALVTKGGKKG